MYGFRDYEKVLNVIKVSAVMQIIRIKALDNVNVKILKDSFRDGRPANKIVKNNKSITIQKC